MTRTYKILCSALLAACLSVVGCGETDVADRPAGCVLADVSGSTKDARTEYSGEFASFARYIGEKGIGEVCLVMAAGDPIAEGAPMYAPVGPSAQHRDSPDFAPEEIQANVEAATTDVKGLLARPPVAAKGSAIVEAAVVAGDVLKEGDCLTILSDGVQHSGATGHFRTIDLSDVGITRLLDRLQQAGLLARLDGVRVDMPLLLFHPGGMHMQAERQVQIKIFWKRWLERTGGVPDACGDSRFSTAS